MELLDIKILNTAIERQINKELAKLDITCTQANVVGFLRLHKPCHADHPQFCRHNWK